MSLTTFRAGLRADLEAALPAGTVYYEYPAETVALPAVVFVPRDPYWTPKQYGVPDMGVRVEFDLHLLVARSVEVNAALGVLEALALDVAAAMKETGRLWLSLGAVEPLEVNNLPALLARMAFSATV